MNEAPTPVKPEAPEAKTSEAKAPDREKIISPKINGPTVLTLARIFLVIPLMFLIFQGDVTSKAFALFFFIVASATDFVDGRWARKEHLVTDLGSFLDPLADKMLLNLTFLALVALDLMPLWMFAVILVRDFAVDGLRMAAAKKGITISAAKVGKLKTTIQMVAVTSILFNRIVNLAPLTAINIGLLFIVTLITVYSGALYLIKGRSILMQA